MTDLPRYDDLPGGSAWGVFGWDDEIGTANLLTADGVRTGAAAVREGRAYPLNWSLDLPRPALLGRPEFRHRLVPLENGYDDAYDDFNPQLSSQWDSLRHVQHPALGFYNGRSAEDIESTTVLGIHHWARRGLVGRFVLVDVEAHREAAGRPLDHAARDAIAPAELDAALIAQGSALQPGTIVVVHTGWTAWYERLDQAAREALADAGMFPAPGLDPGEDTARWLWDNAVAAVVSDCPAVEALPFDVHDPSASLHIRAIAMLGMPFGELFRLEDLAADCRDTGRYEGLFVASPWNKEGGVSSPANAIALV
jgi:kynurenine formamidase